MTQPTRSDVVPPFTMFAGLQMQAIAAMSNFDPSHLWFVTTRRNLFKVEEKSFKFCHLNHRKLRQSVDKAYVLSMLLDVS